VRSDNVETSPSARSVALAAPFLSDDRTNAFARSIKCENRVSNPLLSGGEFDHRRTLGRRHGPWLHASDADQVQIVQTLERRRCVDASAFDRDETHLLEAGYCRVDVRARSSPQRVAQALPIATACPTHDFDDHQVFCVLHRSLLSPFAAHGAG
jgi:hypothetical protein